PLAVVGAQLFARPIYRLGRGGIKPVERLITRAVIIVIAFDDRNIHFADDVQAFFGIGVIADDIAQASVMGALLLLDVFQDDLKSLKIGMDICDDGKLHSATLQFQTREIHFWPRPSLRLPSE